MVARLVTRANPPVVGCGIFQKRIDHHDPVATQRSIEQMIAHPALVPAPHPVDAAARAGKHCLRAHELRALAAPAAAPPVVVHQGLEQLTHLSMHSRNVILHGHGGGGGNGPGGIPQPPGLLNGTHQSPNRPYGSVLFTGPFEVYA